MIPLSLPHSSIGYFTTPSSFRSRVRVIVSVSTPILYPTTSAQMPRLNRRPRQSNVAVDRQKPEVLIAQTADRRPRQVGKIARPKVRRFPGPLTPFAACLSGFRPACRIEATNGTQKLCFR